MRNRLYGGVRGQVNTKEVNTSISVHLLLDCYLQVDDLFEFYCSESSGFRIAAYSIDAIGFSLEFYF